MACDPAAQAAPGDARAGWVAAGSGSCSTFTNDLTAAHGRGSGPRVLCKQTRGNPDPLVRQANKHVPRARRDIPSLALSHLAGVTG